MKNIWFMPVWCYHVNRFPVLLLFHRGDKLNHIGDLRITMWTNLSHHASHIAMLGPFRASKAAAAAAAKEMRIIIILLIHTIYPAHNRSEIQRRTAIFFCILYDYGYFFFGVCGLCMCKGSFDIFFFFVFISSFALRQSSQPSTWPLTQFTFSMEANNLCVCVCKMHELIEILYAFINSPKHLLRKKKFQHLSNEFQLPRINRMRTHLNQDWNNFKGNFSINHWIKAIHVISLWWYRCPFFIQHKKPSSFFCFGSFSRTQILITNFIALTPYVKLSRAGRDHSSNSVLEPRNNVHLKWLNWNHNFRLLSK